MNRLLNSVLVNRTDANITLPGSLTRFARSLALLRPSAGLDIPPLIRKNKKVGQAIKENLPKNFQGARLWEVQTLGKSEF